MKPLLSVERVGIVTAGLLLLLLAEAVWPYRHTVERRYRRYLINGFLMGSNALLLSVLLGGLLVAAYQAFELQRVGLLHALGIEDGWNVCCSVVLLDGVTYLWHRAYHGVPLMWRMHRVHHSDRDLDVTTSGRFHLTEMALSAALRLGVIALIGANVASIVLFEIVFGAFNQLEHANVQLPRRLDRRLRAIVVTPAMHRVHHFAALRYTNSNYGTIFSFWDRLCGTYRVVEEQQAPVIGLPEYQQSQDVALGRVLAMPWGPPCGVGHGVATA